MSTAEFYKKLQHARDFYPQAVDHQQEDGEASAALRSTEVVLVCQEGHKLSLPKVCEVGGPKRRPETARLSSTREIEEGMVIELPSLWRHQLQLTLHPKTSSHL